MQTIARHQSRRLSLALTLTIGFILACNAATPTEPEPPIPQIVYNDGTAGLRQPVPELSVCEQNRTLISERQTGQRNLDQMYEETKQILAPPADPRTPYPEWMAKEYDRTVAQHRSASARYHRAVLIASGLTSDAYEYCAGHNEQYPSPRQCQKAFLALTADGTHLNPSLYQLGAIRACLETNAFHREPIGSP